MTPLANLVFLYIFKFNPKEESINNYKVINFKMILEISYYLLTRIIMGYVKCISSLNLIKTNLYLRIKIRIIKRQKIKTSKKMYISILLYRTNAINSFLYVMT